LSDGGRKDVAPAGVMLRGHRRDEYGGNRIGGCLISDEQVSIPILPRFSKHLWAC